ncbi:tetratricopeptide repeat protein [Thiobacillus sp.]
MKMLTKLMLGLAGLVMTLPAAAEWKPSPAEMATLPSYCAARFDEKSAAFKTWRDSMGSDFMHVHHYCAGLNFVNRARGMGSSNKDRRGTLEAALRNFDYMLAHTHPDFSLRPEILMNRGIALSMMNRTGEAVGDLMKAIEADPKQPRAYMTLADLYSKQKNRAKALETVTEGLRHNPDTKSLQRRYTELGGKLPYPPPVEPAPVAVQVNTDAIPAAEPGSTPSPVEPADSAPTSPAETAAAPPKIGSPTNPYCRFCPD